MVRVAVHVEYTFIRLQLLQRADSVLIVIAISTSFISFLAFYCWDEVFRVTHWSFLA